MSELALVLPQILCVSLLIRGITFGDELVAGFFLQSISSVSIVFPWPP